MRNIHHKSDYCNSSELRWCPRHIKPDGTRCLKLLGSPRSVSSHLSIVNPLDLVPHIAPPRLYLGCRLSVAMRW